MNTTSVSMLEAKGQLLGFSLGDSTIQEGGNAYTMVNNMDWDTLSQSRAAAAGPPILPVLLTLPAPPASPARDSENYDVQLPTLTESDLMEIMPEPLQPFSKPPCLVSERTRML